MAVHCGKAALRYQMISMREKVADKKALSQSPCKGALGESDIFIYLYCVIGQTKTEIRAQSTLAIIWMRL